MTDYPTYNVHAPHCLVTQAWDIPEAYDRCSCRFPYPYPVCSKCHNRPHQHARECPRHPKNKAAA